MFSYQDGSSYDANHCLDGIWGRGLDEWLVPGSGGESGAMAEWGGVVAEDELK